MFIKKGIKKDINDFFNEALPPKCLAVTQASLGYACHVYGKYVKKPQSKE
jgi:hypothetical protein